MTLTKIIRYFQKWYRLEHLAFWGYEKKNWKLGLFSILGQLLIGWRRSFLWKIGLNEVRIRLAQTTHQTFAVSQMSDFNLSQLRFIFFRRCSGSSSRGDLRGVACRLGDMTCYSQVVSYWRRPNGLKRSDNKNT